MTKQKLNFTGCFSIELHVDLSDYPLPKKIIYDEARKTIIAPNDRVSETMNGITISSNDKDIIHIPLDDVKIVRSKDEALWSNPSYEAVKQELRGNIFRGELAIVLDTNSPKFGTTYPRKCSFCTGRNRTDCILGDKYAKHVFNSIGQKLPKILEGKEVGNFCSYFELKSR